MTFTPSIASSLRQSTLIDILRLIRSENVGPVTFFALIRQFGTAASALAAIPELSLQGGKRKPAATYSAADAEKEMHAATKAGAKWLSIAEAEYPPLLSTIYDPPPLLMALGSPSVWQQKRSIAVVGARNASATGCQFARKLAQDAGAQGFIVTSGLARGVDTAAHHGALASGTVAVMASGIGQIYPPENKILHDAIAQQGCIITEQPFNALPHSRAFPGRNRIISGMSLGTVIVEAALKSGSLITARYALDQGREVFAVPGSPLDPRCKGTNQLLRQGAHICESVEDIVHNLPSHTPHVSEASPSGFISAPSAPANDAQRAEARQLILSKLGYTPVLVDELLTQCTIGHDLLSLILLELELAGRLQRHPGHKVALTFLHATNE